MLGMAQLNSKGVWANLFVASVTDLEDWDQYCHCLLFEIVAHLWHWCLALEATPDPVIDTLGFPPCLLDADIAVRLVAPKPEVKTQDILLLKWGQT
jgi:hypothetical protein